MGALIGLLTGPGALLIDAESFGASSALLRYIRKAEVNHGRIDQGEQMRERIGIDLKCVGSSPTLRA